MQVEYFTYSITPRYAADNFKRLATYILFIEFQVYAGNLLLENVIISIKVYLLKHGTKLCLLKTGSLFRVKTLLFAVNNDQFCMYTRFSNKI